MMKKIAPLFFILSWLVSGSLFAHNFMQQATAQNTAGFDRFARLFQETKQYSWGGVWLADPLLVWVYKTELTAQEEQEIIALVQQHGLLYCLEESHEQLVQKLMQQGFVISAQEPAMALDLQTYIPKQITHNNEFVTVTSLESTFKLHDWIAASNGEFEGYLYTGDWYELFTKVLPSPHAVFYVSYYNNVPVCRRLVVRYENCIQEQFVATHPAYRRQGFATRQWQQMVHDHQQLGYRMVTLQASEDGMRFAQSCGMQHHATYVLLTKPPVPLSHQD